MNALEFTVTNEGFHLNSIPFHHFVFTSLIFSLRFFVQFIVRLILCIYFSCPGLGKRFHPLNLFSSLFLLSSSFPLVSFLDVGACRPRRAGFVSCVINSFVHCSFIPPIHESMSPLILKCFSCFHLFFWHPDLKFFRPILKHFLSSASTFLFSQVVCAFSHWRASMFPNKENSALMDRLILYS